MNFFFTSLLIRFEMYLMDHNVPTPERFRRLKLRRRDAERDAADAGPSGKSSETKGVFNYSRELPYSDVVGVNK